jgi:hypothetical protein
MVLDFSGEDARSSAVAFLYLCCGPVHSPSCHALAPRHLEAAVQLKAAATAAAWQAER